MDCEVPVEFRMLSRTASLPTAAMVSCKERGGAEWAHAEAAANARSNRTTARHLYTPSQRRVQLYSMAQPRPRFKTRQVTETSSPSRPLLRPARRPRARHPATRLRSDSARHGQVEGEGRAIRRNMRHCRASSSSLQQEIAGREALDPPSRSTFSALEQLATGGSIVLIPRALI